MGGLGGLVGVEYQDYITNSARLGYTSLFELSVANNIRSNCFFNMSNIDTTYQPIYHFVELLPSSAQTG